jgi:hypothetical protein
LANKSSCTVVILEHPEAYRVLSAINFCRGQLNVEIIRKQVVICPMLGLYPAEYPPATLALASAPALKQQAEASKRDDKESKRGPMDWVAHYFILFSIFHFPFGLSSFYTGHSISLVYRVASRCLRTNDKLTGLRSGNDK